jgi:hypothetical protein
MRVRFPPLHQDTVRIKKTFDGAPNKKNLIYSCNTLATGLSVACSDCLYLVGPPRRRATASATASATAPSWSLAGLVHNIRSRGLTVYLHPTVLYIHKVWQMAVIIWYRERCSKIKNCHLLCYNTPSNMRLPMFPTKVLWIVYFLFNTPYTTIKLWTEKQPFVLQTCGSLLTL